MSTLRQRLDFLHTWSGVVLGALVFLVFVMGTLAVFDREIDRWMKPSLRFAAPAEPIELDRLARPLLEREAGNARHWRIAPPNPREPALVVGWRDAGSGRDTTRHLDPRSGEPIDVRATRGGNFFYAIHYRVHLGQFGYWLAGLAGVALLAALVSGVVIHRRIFTDFFTLRPRVATRRRLLDLHNLTSVVALPFHAFMAFSGLVVFYGIYMHAGFDTLYGGDRRAYFREAQPRVERPATGTAVPLASLDAMVARARARWGSGEPETIAITSPGDAAAVVLMHRRAADKLALRQYAFTSDAIYLDGTSGEILLAPEPSTAFRTQAVISGIHLVQFDHWWLKWLYFALGLLGCVMIATGLALWVEKRRARHGASADFGYRIAYTLTIAGTIGVVIASLAMLVANQSLPEGLDRRADREVHVHFAAWIASGIHAWRCAARDSWARGWVAQCGAAALLATLAVALNGLTTGDHPLAAATTGRWAVLGTDAVLLLAAIAFASLAVGLARTAPRAREDATRASPGDRESC
jgi:uncharacterized iron-regulated membrane protein